MPIRHRDRPEDGRVGMGQSSPVSTQRPGPHLRPSGRPRMPTMGGCGSSAGAGSIPFPTCMPSGARGHPVRSSAGPSSDWRWSISPNQPKLPCPFGSGGGDRSLPDLETIWRVYVARFSIEHTFRFFKQVLKWTTPKLRSPEAADRWTWLVMLAYVQLRLARPLVVDHRLPWQAPLPAEKLTPARVRRAYTPLLPLLGRMASAPKACGRSPGRPKGRKSVPAQRFPVIKLTA